MKILDEDLLYIGNSLSEKEKEFYRDSVIVVSGCAGSLGYELLHFLVYHSGAKKIIGIDNCCLGYPKWLKRIADNKQIDFYREDIATIKLDSVMDAEKADIVFHMASVASPTSYRSFPFATMDANVGGCLNLLQFYQNKRLKNFCYFSSSEIYGSPDNDNIPTKESYYGNVNPVGPRSCYDESKRYSETICYNFAEKYKIPCTILRPFNIYGPGMKLNDKRIPADCIQAIFNDENIKIFSDGTPTRTFCYISDAVVWILKSVCHCGFEIFNIGMDKPEMTMYEFANLCSEIAAEKRNYRKKVEFAVSDDKHYLTDNPTRRCPDLCYSQKKLDFRPLIPTKEGLERYIEFFTECESDIKEEWNW